MASKKERQMAKEYIKRAIQLSQAFETEANRMGREVQKLHEQIMNKIEKEYSGIFSNKKMTELSQELADDIVTYYNNGVLPTIDTAFNTVIERETGWNEKTLAAFSTASVIRINSSVVAKRAMNKPYQGHLFRTWFNAHTENEWKKVSALLKNGYVTGKTTSEIKTEVGKILGRSDSDIRTLTRSYLQHAAHEARVDVLKENNDLVESYVWVATLDSRTTPLICGIRDGLEWDKNYQPIGHDIPWSDGPGRIHFNCRSTFIPKLKDTPNITDLFSRPAVNAGSEYESGDNKTKTGKPRKPTAKNVDNGIFNVTQVRGGTKYEDWLKRQRTAYISDIFNNEEYAKEFKAGKISLTQISKQKDLTVNQL